MDLKNIDLKDIKVSDLTAKLKTVDKKTLIKFGAGFFAVIIFLIGYYLILNPIVKEKKAQYEDKVLKETEITQFEGNIITIKKRLKKLKPEFEESSTLFHSKAEVEGLYQSLSRFAGINGLTISKIEKRKPKPILKPGVAQQAAELLKKSDISYYQIPVEYEIKGNFLGYIKFKRSIASFDELLIDFSLLNWLLFGV